MVPSTTVWYPEIYFLNPADKMVPVGKKYFKARVYDMGGVSRIVGSIIKTTCDVDITYFPFDEQTCEIDFYTFGHSSNEIFFRISETDIDLTYFRKNAQWEVTESRLKPHDKVKFNGTITAVIGLKRYPEYFIVNILIPVLFLCLLNPFVFLLPPESGERISYTVTIFLSLAVFMTLINDNMPKSSRPMSRLSIFLVIMIGFSTALCILAIVNTKLYFRDKAIPVSSWMKKTMDILKFKWCSKLSGRCRSKVTHKNDTDKSGDSQEHKDVMEPFPEKTTWKKFATEIDIVAFCYTLFFLALTCTIFIITGLI
ncbi:hypothetical protein FSP39_017816 [Pinctada imbricata]|uniref:Uncharacterized protein n=1 Tax=Pinctada imbricata TaxID=66713 RepID=A0AA89C7Z4_PINIB|nr:hypothetical protein FSP39_017816 [Pinctada imbricata]